MKRSLILPLTLLLWVAGCRQNQVRAAAGIEAYGLVESSVDHPALGEAVQMANVVLGPKSTKFAAGWSGAGDRKVILVYAATPMGLGKNEVVTSFPQCQCVVVQVGRMQEWLKLQSGSNSAQLSIETKTLLAYMLLHEMGHITHGDIVSSEGDGQGASTSLSKYNLDPTAQKAKEVDADQFAAKSIADGMHEKGTDRGLAATELAVTLAKLSWNLNAHRGLDNFAPNILGEPSVFYDAGLSHPNLEWRILSVNAAIDGSPTSAALLHDFEERRQPENYVLFRAKP
jgi:hypothetical protein